MADKKFTEKVGRDGLIDFDPVNGIMRYGSYEVFAKDIGVTPARHEITFDDYLDASKSKGGGMASLAAKALVPPTPEQTKQIRSQFEADVTSGRFGPQKQSGTSFSMSGVTTNKPAYVFQEENRLSQILDAGLKRPKTTFRNVQKLGPDSFAVDIYDFGGDQYDLVNKIGERAQGLSRTGSDSAVLQQNQQDAKARRQGRASTVLST
jgi:hypothetical protein